MTEQTPKPFKQTDKVNDMNDLFARSMLGDVSAFWGLYGALVSTIREGLSNKLIDPNNNLGKGTEPIVDNEPGGVQLYDWSKSDQQRMLYGQKPKGIPIHRNL